MSGVKSKIRQFLDDLEVSDEAAEQQETSSSVTFGLSATSTEPSENAEATSAGAAGLLTIRHVKELQEKVVELLAERRHLTAQQHQELAERESEIDRLQQYIDKHLGDLQQRQLEVEDRAPVMQLQLQEAKEALRNLSISETLYAELIQRPSDQLSLSESVQVAVHQELQALKAENEQLRLAASTAREARQRLEVDNTRLQRENTRHAAAVVDKEREADSSIAALQQRLERLSSELEEAAVQVEVLTAKGRMYDELQARAEQLESELHQLRAAETANQRLQAQLDAAASDQKDLQHRHELVLMDKAYLSKQVEGLEDRLRKTEGELEAQQAKVTDLKRARQELHQKLYEAGASRHEQEESRIQQEIARIQAAATADLDRIRREAAEVSERELRALRELRDAALDEAARLRSELRTLQGQHEELLLEHREGTARLDVKVTELLGELKLKGFELQRVEALADERAAAVSSLTLEVELLTAKVRLLTEQLHNSESAQHRQLGEVKSQLEAAEAQLAQYQALEGVAAAGAELDFTALAGEGQAGCGTSGEDQPAAMQRRLHHNLQLASRCARLDTERRLLAREKEELEQRLSAVERKLSLAEQRLTAVGQPHGYLLEQLERAQKKQVLAEGEVAALRQRLEQLAAEQAAQERQAQAAVQERQALKADLERVLKERGRFESLKHLVVAALGSAPQQLQQQGGVGTQPAYSHQQQQQAETVQSLQQSASASTRRMDGARLVGNVQA